MKPKTLLKASSGKTPKRYTSERARADVLAKLEKAGIKGAGSPITKSTPEEKRAVIESVLAELESAHEIFIDRRKAKPKLYRWAHRPQLPTAASIAPAIERAAEQSHPRLLTAPELKKALGKDKDAAALFAEALALLVEQRRLLVLQRASGKKIIELHAHADSLRADLGETERRDALPRVRASPSDAPDKPTAPDAQERVPPTEPATLDPARIRAAYRTLVERTGFPAVPITALARESATPLDLLKPWLLAEYRAGRAIPSSGDWSLADEAKRAGALEIHGERCLLVRLTD